MEQMTIFDFIENPNEPKKEPLEFGACIFSKHKCNREELFKIAKTFDDVNCPCVCCRDCSEALCGARCNGSEHPAKQKSAWELFHEVCSKRGWHKEATETEPSKWMCGFNNCQNARCWGDWIECKEANCPILKKENK